MDYKYSVEEILGAVNDLQNLKKNKIKKNINEPIKTENSSIPNYTLKLIEEAEKSKR